MNDNVFFLSLLGIVSGTILVVVALVNWNTQQTTEKMIKAGYEYKLVPVQMSSQWVKPESK